MESLPSTFVETHDPVLVGLVDTNISPLESAAKHKLVEGQLIAFKGEIAPLALTLKEVKGPGLLMITIFPFESAAKHHVALAQVTEFSDDPGSTLDIFQLL